MVLTVTNNKIVTGVYKKPTDTGLYTHFLSSVDIRYKKGLLFTMFNRAHRLSSMPELFNEECNRLTNVFIKLKYPPDLISNVRARVGTMSVSGEDTSKKLLRVSIPFKSQKSADVMRK